MSELSEVFKSMNTEIRNERMDRFESDILPSFVQAGYNFIISEDRTKFTTHDKEFGYIDIFPKANKLLIRKDNKWVKPAVRWMTKNLLKIN